MWHVTHRGWRALCKNFRSLALTVWELWVITYELWVITYDWLSHLINDGGVCRTAPAKPGLLITLAWCYLLNSPGYIRSVSDKTPSPNLHLYRKYFSQTLFTFLNIHTRSYGPLGGPSSSSCGVFWLLSETIFDSGKEPFNAVIICLG